MMTKSININIAETLRDKVIRNAGRVAERYEHWPSYAPPEDALHRVPEANGVAPGFDAFIAACLGLVPEIAWRLISMCHGAWSPEAVELLRETVKGYCDPDNHGTWWAAMSAVCQEGNVDLQTFLFQIGQATAIANSDALRHQVADFEFRKMKSTYDLKRGYPRGTEDGCIQGAYIKGHDFGVHEDTERKMFFIGTFHPSLGIPSDFDWSSEVDETGKPKSGIIHPNFIKCANEDELTRVIDAIKLS